MNWAEPWILLLLATGTAQGGEIVLFDGAIREVGDKLYEIRSRP